MIGKDIQLKGANKKLVEGVNILANAVKSTLGASGKTVIIEDAFGNPTITKDGVTVAKSIFLKDRVMDMGAQVIKQSAIRTGNDAGDGTTTSTVIAQSIINLAQEIDTSKYLLSEVKKGIDKSTEQIVEELNSVAIEVDSKMLLNVATISTNNDEELGQVIASAFKLAGENGVVTMEESPSSKTYIDKIEGLEFNRGYSSRVFVNNVGKERCVLNNPLILLCDIKIQNIRQIQPIMEFCINNSTPLVIIAEMEEDVLNTIALNKVKGGMKVCAIKPPIFGVKRKDMMEDLATITGASLISDETGDNFENLEVSMLGGVKKITVTKSSTTLVSQSTESTTELDEQIENLKLQIKENDNDDEEKWLKERIANLTSGVVVVNVGGNSEIEIKEKADRVDDAIHATKAALEEGVVSGGGIALYDASFKIDTEGYTPSMLAGAIILIAALREPLITIINNAEKDEDEIIEEIANTQFDSGHGYDVKRNIFGNMIELGIIDPLKVTKNALINAVSVAGTIISTECTVTNLINHG